MSRPSFARLLPTPRFLTRQPGYFALPRKNPAAAIKILPTNTAPAHAEGYALTIDRRGVTIEFRESPGLRAAAATLRQLYREFGSRLPCLKIRDWPDFARRGVMLDISRGRVPSLATLLDLAEKLADFKINELQLYTEHTFAYPRYRRVWQSWGALTAAEIRRLDARCRELGIDLVPNQNSFGHLRYLLADPRLRKLAELSKPYEADTKDFLRRPTTLAPNHPRTLPFLRELYDQLLPNFSSRFFNVGCDETWDLGKGQSRDLCEHKGKGRVYLDFLKEIHREVSARGRTMMFWGDIILKHPELIDELAAFGRNRLSNGGPGIIALNWGYEADHPFEKEAARFARAGIPFYVCPGTSTWQTLIGRHDNALANLRAAAKVGKRFHALGYLNTDWGDGGHPQPLAVSWPMFAAGAALAWNSKKLSEEGLVYVLNRDIYEDRTGRVGKAAFDLGFIHRLLRIRTINETPLGTVVAAPKPEDRELFCRNGLKWFGKIPRRRILSALKQLRYQRALMRSGQPESDAAVLLAVELDLAARMAMQSCQYMLWQQAAADEQNSEARALAMQNVRELQRLERDFKAYWPLRNKGTPRHSSPFLQWRIRELMPDQKPTQRHAARR